MSIAPASSGVGPSGPAPAPVARRPDTAPQIPEPSTSPAFAPVSVASVSERLDLLARAALLCEGRVEAGVLDDVRAVSERAGERALLSPGHTVVALAGATGSGKSTLFNALAGIELSDVGVRRPTTSTAMACIWGTDPADDVLDWLDVPQRRRVVRDSELDAEHDPGLQGLVLLDLPDHDSRQVAHRMEVDRLVRMVDLLVWVLDPQKYADAALHDRYLRAMRSRQSCMLAVLNQVDTLKPAEIHECLNDLRRLLAAEGLPDVPVVGISGQVGTGLDELRALLVERVTARRGLADRLEADLRMAVDRLAGAAVCSPGPQGEGVPVEHLEGELVDRLTRAAGVPALVETVEAEHLAVGLAIIDWPPARWVDRSRRDPLEVIRAREEERARAGRAMAEALAVLEVPAAEPGPSAQEPTPVQEEDAPAASSPAESSPATPHDGEGEGGPARGSADRPAGAAAAPVRRAPTDETRVDESVRSLVETATARMPHSWQALVRARLGTAARGLVDELDEALDERLAQAMPGSSRYPVYLWVVQVLQWVLLAGVVVGVAWTGYLVGMVVGGTPPEPTRLGVVPLPVALLAVGVVGGFAVTALAPRLVRRSAAARREQVEQATLSAVHDVAQRLVLQPLAQETRRHSEAVAALEHLRGR